MLKKNGYTFEQNSVIFASAKAKLSFRDQLFESEHCQSGKKVPPGCTLRSGQVRSGQVRSDQVRSGQVSPDQVQTYPCGDNVDVAGTLLKLGDNVKSLRVTFDRELSFDKHVNLMGRASKYHLWSLRRIRKYLTVDRKSTRLNSSHRL